jgi:putative ATP-dependent endonuclease of OLD family
MKLVSITVKNYRSITKAHKLQLGSSTVLIGRNNEGKSNILRALVAALSFLRLGRHADIHRGAARQLYIVPVYERQRLYNWENDFPIALQKTQPDGKSEVTLEFELEFSELQLFKRRVGSNLNTNLPVKMMLGRQDFAVTIVKQGPGGKGLTSKAPLIAEFIRDRLNFQYIPAVRTARSAHEVVDDMLAAALAPLESDSRYKGALRTIADLQKPVLEAMSQSIKNTLVQFLPAIKHVKVQIASEQRNRALRTSSEIVIDDGTATPLKHKGDGVQSLAAIALMRHAASVQSTGKNTIVALEEPESHLHPNAIHELRGVLQDLAKTQQIVVTTHCPLFVDRTQISANIIVGDNKARSARSIMEIRDMLGVRAADNLRHAELVLVVEGAEDVTVLSALLPTYSDSIGQALQQGSLVISPLDGAGNLPYKLRILRDSLCDYHCYLDHDDAGRKAFEDARENELVTDADGNFTICNGMKQSEIEDMFAVESYRSTVESRYNVTLNVATFRTSSKWSERMKATFKSQGKSWSARVAGEVKAIVAHTVASTPNSALNAHKRGSFDGLVTAIEKRLAQMHR